MNRPRSGPAATGLALLLTGLLVAPAASSSEARPASAWEALVVARPGVVEDPALTPLERRVLAALTPQQAVAFAAGAEATTLVLASGGTLADLLETLGAEAPVTVYVPAAPCIVLRTVESEAGRMEADELRPFAVRGDDLSDQGGEADGCGVPPVALAALLRFRVVAAPAQTEQGYLRAWAADGPEPPTRRVDYPATDEQTVFGGMSVVGLCPEERCPEGDILVRTGQLGAQVRADLIGWFRAAIPADFRLVPPFDADTLDGLDSTELALAGHTHSGSDVTSGLVAEAFLDPDLARDAEVLPEVLAVDGTGSGLDADLLDGIDGASFELRLERVLEVAPEGAPFTSIQAALDAAAAIGGPVLVRVAPGVYAESLELVPQVRMVGSGIGATRVVSGADGVPTVSAAQAAILEGLTVENSGGGSAAIGLSATAPVRLERVEVVVSGGATRNVGIAGSAGAAPVLVDGRVVVTGSGAVGVEASDGAGPGSTARWWRSSGAAVRVGAGSAALAVSTRLVGSREGAGLVCLGSYDGAFAELPRACGEAP